MSKLAERIRKNREIKVKAGRWTFTARRPTDVEGGPMIADLFKDVSDPSKMVMTKDFAHRVARDHVIGWNLIEDDLVGGGGQDAVEFDADAWAEWIADHSDLWGDIALPIVKAYIDRVVQTDETAKNSAAG
jgi:hypothetical protein